MPGPVSAPLGGHALLVFLCAVAMLLLAALLLGRLAARFGLPAVSGELCAGVLVGPTVLGHVAPGVYHWLLPPQAEQTHLLDAAGQLGVILLVGMTGAEIDLGLVRRRGATAVRVAIAGLVLPLALGVAAGCLAPGFLLPAGPGRPLFALFVGVAMSVSALPVIAKTLGDMGLLHRDFGQLTIAAGVIDDVIGWLLLSVVSAAGVAGLHWHALDRPLILLAVFGPLAMTAGRAIARAALAAAGRMADAGPAVGLGALMILGCAAATQSMGLEASFGAFVGGLMLGAAATPDLRRLEPLRAVVNSVLAPLFFATAGLRLDLTLLGRPAALLCALAALALAVLGKFSGAFLGGRASRLDAWESLALGAGMNARGVIQLIVASVGLRLGILNTTAYTILVLVAISTSLMAAPILRLAERRIGHSELEDERRARLAARREPAARAAGGGLS
jgi:Kef-type K+ transport system membrane component KefB